MSQLYGNTFSNDSGGISPTHLWNRSTEAGYTYWVVGLGDWAKSGPAIADDFGNLVSVS